MTVSIESLERYRHYLKVLARIQIDRDLQHKVDDSDVVQETLLKACQALPQYRGSSERELRSWLRRILATTLADAIRPLWRQKRRVDRERSLEAAIDDSSNRLEDWLAADQSSPSEQCLSEERLRMLTEALDELPDDQREAVTRHHLQECSLDEVARQMDRSTPSVAGLIRRGLVALRRRLDSAR